VLIGAPDFGLGRTAEDPVPHEHPALPSDDVHDTPHPYPLSVPLADVAEVEEITLVDDGTKVRDRMHVGFISCTRDETIQAAATTMIDNDIHALVVTEGDKVVGVLSQTDLMLARQGRTLEEARGMHIGQFMTEGCATCDIDTPMSEAITQMMKMRIHRVLVTENDKPVGVLSMTDVVRKLMG
jgi:crotonyl-CoA carboxylase/reductase